MISNKAINEEKEGCVSEEEQTYFQFLSQRSESNYKRKPSTKRRSEISQKTGKIYPHISDVALLWLYEKARDKNGRQQAHEMTDAEITFLDSLKKIIKRNPGRYKNVDFIPFGISSKQDLEPKKILLGEKIPDFMVLGLRYSKDYLGVIFEINGESHEHPEKAAKDAELHILAMKLGFAVLPIENKDAGRVDYIEKILTNLSPCNTKDSKKQILRLKRRLWIFTVSYHFSLAEIENLIWLEFGTILNLEDELSNLLQLSDCPRRIRYEARINGFPPNTSKK